MDGLAALDTPYAWPRSRLGVTFHHECNPADSVSKKPFWAFRIRQLCDDVCVLGIHQPPYTGLPCIILVLRGGKAKGITEGLLSAPSNTKGYSSTYLAMGFANVRAGTHYRYIYRNKNGESMPRCCAHGATASTSGCCAQRCCLGC